LTREERKTRVNDDDGIWGEYQEETCEHQKYGDRLVLDSEVEKFNGTKPVTFDDFQKNRGRI